MYILDIINYETDRTLIGCYLYCILIYCVLLKEQLKTLQYHKKFNVFFLSFQKIKL